jgi:putative ABC transport system permease protein
MWTLARRNLLKERTRLAISIGGVAFAVTLMILLRGLYMAYEEKVRDFYGAMHVDAWVMQSGTADKLADSALKRSLEPKLAAVAGVAEALPYKARHATFKLNGAEAELYIAGFDNVRSGADTGPLRMESGTRAISDDQIIVDKVFAHKHGLTLGDGLDILGEKLAVAGISSGGDFVSFQYGFVTNDRARTLLKNKDLVNAFLLRLEPGADLETVTAGVKSVTKHTAVKSAAEVIEENERVVKKGFLPVLGVLMAIGFCVGVAVIGLTIFSAVLEHRREYGVLKALGARPTQMLTVVAVQALSAAVAGYVAGIVVSLLAARAAAEWVPQFVTHLVLGDVLAVGVVALLMGLTAAVIPLRSIAHVDAAIVFRA